MLCIIENGVFRPPIFTFKQALDLHRLLMSPQMYNNPKAMVRLRLELNMNLEKKVFFTAERDFRNCLHSHSFQSKKVKEVDQIVPSPFPFQHGNKRVILAFAKSEDIQKQAIEAGADTAGGPDLVKKVSTVPHITT